MSERRFRFLLAGLGLGSFGVLVTLELVTALGEGLDPLDFAVDTFSLILTIGAAVGVALLVQRVNADREERAALVADLSAARADGEVWRAQVHGLTSDLRAAIHDRFRAWSMTEAENDVGFLMLKGLSHKEIARVRGASEATVRQQASAIFRKSGLASRAAFSAYFLDDLLETQPQLESADA